MECRKVLGLVELRATRFRALPLTADHGVELQRLLESCADFFELVLGRPPGAAEAQSVFSAGPEDGKHPDNKLMYRIVAPDSDQMIGVLDAFRDYPEEGTWYIGLLLLLPSTRGSGLGAEIVEAFASAARLHGARELQLNVVAQNESAHRFWSECGFIDVRRWQQHYGKRASTFVRMRRPLRSHERLAQLSSGVSVITADEKYRETVARLEADVAASSEPFVWSVVGMTSSLAAVLPADIKSAWIFVLRSNTPSIAHFHPNSVQHMALMKGRGKSQIGGSLRQMTCFADATNPEDAWTIIERGVPHEFFPDDEPMTVISFHTCAAGELVEVDAASGRKRAYEVSLTD